MPKDVFPAIKIDKILVNGSYAGASINSLDKMAVSDLERDLKSLSGINKIESYVKNGQFSIILSLDDGVNKIDVLNKTKDVISQNRSSMPSDMDEPVATVLDWAWPLINITISSQTKTKDELIEIAQKIKDDISTINGISKTELSLSTTKVFEIIVDNKKLDAYGIDKQLLYNKIKQLSYIYPIGKIEDIDEHLYLSTPNGIKTSNEYLNTQVKVSNKVFYIKDIAVVKSGFLSSDIISKLNGSSNVEIRTYKGEKSNAITLVDVIKDEVKNLNNRYDNIHIDTFYDTSIYIKNRLNTVISGILFGLVLVSIAMYLLINKRVAFIVVLGIPTSILIGVVILSFTDYTINMITLLGALLILGVLVDDAVIIAENIQRHIVRGEDKLTSAINGTKEVITPVFASSVTTVFAFLPMVVLSGEMGQFLILIPVAIVILLFASLVESLVFLPIHSYHLLSKNDKELDWTKAQDWYANLLIKLLNYKKSILLFFIIFIPVLTIWLISGMKFQMFPDFDGDRVFIKGKFSPNHTVEQTCQKTQIIEDILLKHKEELYFKNISYVCGQRTDNEEKLETKQSVFQFNIELHSRVPINFVDKYITPIVSLGEETSPKIRSQSVNETITKLKELLKDYKPKELKDFSIKKEGAGVTANDIEILLSTDDKKLLLESINSIEHKLNSIKGIVFVNNNAKLGIKELKLKPNSYGQTLGFTESDLAMQIYPLFLKSSISKGLGDSGVFEIIVQDANIDDFDTLKSLYISVPNSNQKVLLYDICDFIYIHNFDSLSKINLKDTKMVVANVNNEVITSIEALKILEPIFDEYKSKGVNISFGGEQEQNDIMAKEMSIAFFIALFLIFFTLLIMFDSFILSLMVVSIIPLSVLGAIWGHMMMDMNLSLTSVIGILGLAGVVINDAIVMLDFIKNSQTFDETINRAKLRLRPIVITSITTFLGLATLIFFATGQAKILQPIAISLGFGLVWGTVLTLVYLPIIFVVSKRFKS
jgi:multidrug efflux pump subunit AcrB